MLSRGSQLNGAADSAEKMRGTRVCGNRLIFRINKHKSSASRVLLCRVIPSPRVSIDHPRILVSLRWWHALTHTREEYNGDNYVFRGHRRGGTRGTSHWSVEARAAAIRQPVVERSSLECLTLYAR